MEIKDYNFVIDWRNFFSQSIKNDLKTYDKIWKIATCQGDDYPTGCLLDYSYFKKYYELIAIDLRKQQKLDAIQQINFTRSLTRDQGARMYFNWRSQRNIFRFFKRSS